MSAAKCCCRVIFDFIQNHQHLAKCELGDKVIALKIKPRGEAANEEERSRLPTVFSVVRTIVDLFRSDEDEMLGLYGCLWIRLSISI